MKQYLLILHKWTIVLSLFFIPYYIHNARIERILNHYSHKSNAIYIIISIQKLNATEASLASEIILQTSTNIEQLQFIIFHPLINKLKSISLTKNFYINPDFPPPVLA